jgi:hypothetical protein
MIFCRRTAVVIRLWARVVAVVATALAVRAEQIQFSKPAVEIAAPARAEEFLPSTSSKRLDFDAPQVAPPVMMPQATIIGRLPRHDEADEEEKRFSRHHRPGRWEESGLRKLSDRDSRDRIMAPKDGFPSRPNTDSFGLELPGSQRALSPVMDFNWDARDAAKSRNASFFGNPDTVDRNERSELFRSAFSAGGQQESVSERSFQGARFSDWFGGGPKEKPSQDILERRTAFEQLLNPDAGVAGRAPGSLEPLPSLDRTTLAPGLPMPTISGRPKGQMNAADPMEAFNQQHSRLRGPSLDDVNKKYDRPKSAPVSSVVDSRFQTPLNRQPTSREFPTRKF